MDLDDLQGVFDLLWEAEEKFPDAWRVFFSEWGEPVEARREAFATLLGYVNSHYFKRAPGMPHGTPVQQQNLLCIALLSTLPLGTLDNPRVERYMRDLVPAMEEMEHGDLPPFDSAALLGSIPPPAPRPTGSARFRSPTEIDVRCKPKNGWGFEIVVNRGVTEQWDFLGATSQWIYIDTSAHEPDEDTPAPPTPPERWSYRLRYILPPKENSAYKPVGMWSDRIPVTPPI